MLSPVAKRLVGAYIADSFRPLTSLAAWAQYECRNGSLRDVVEDFAAAQEEPLDVELLLVERVDSDGILARIPCKIKDHESPRPFMAEVWLKVNPFVRVVSRVSQP